MKNVLIILLCVVLLVPFCGCSATGNESATGTVEQSAVTTAPPETQTPTEETVKETVAETTVATQPPETQPATEAVQIPVEPFIWLKSLEEYNAVISRIDHPSLRVTYDDFSQIGQFIDVRFYNADAEDEAERDYMKASYSLQDETGTKFDLHISYYVGLFMSEGEVELLDSELDPNDMRSSVVDISSHYDYNGIRYYYFTGGGLKAIYWTAGGIEYCLLATTSFSRHPLDQEDSFISGLLKLETVEATLAQVDVFVD